VTTLVVPVKCPSVAKSRLRPHVDRASDLAFAFAIDTLAAGIACRGVTAVVVVTGDDDVRRAATTLGATVVADEGGGLNGAVRRGIRGLVGPVAVLTGDLPALRPADLDDALRLAERLELAMVADHDGTGTTMLFARDPARLDPHFGPGSRAEHERRGHVMLDVDPRSPLRWDVDTRSDFETALGMGVGPATAHAVADGAMGGRDRSSADVA